MLGEDGAVDVVTRTPNWVSGLGWDPDGGLLIVSVADTRLLRFKEGVLEEAANLTDSATVEGDHRMINDMIVGPNGDAYIGVMVYEVEKVLEMPTVKATRHPPTATGTYWRQQSADISPDSRRSKRASPGRFDQPGWPERNGDHSRWGDPLSGRDRCEANSGVPAR